MPLYEYRCKNGHKSSAIRAMAESALPQDCPSCPEIAERIISPVRVFGDYSGYVSPATGKWVEGRRARVEDLKQSGCRPYEEGEREQAVLRAAAADRQLDKDVDAVVEQILPKLDLSASDERLHEQAANI